MSDHDDDDRIPLLEDVVRSGREPTAQPATANGALTEADIEAIAARVVERHTKEMEQAVARAIRTALDSKTRAAGSPNGAPDPSREDA